MTEVKQSTQTVTEEPHIDEESLRKRFLESGMLSFDSDKGSPVEAIAACEDEIRELAAMSAEFLYGPLRSRP